MYSINVHKNIFYYILSANKEDNIWTEALVVVHDLSIYNSVESGKKVLNPFLVYKNNHSLKIRFSIKNKINIKITDQTGAPVYLRQRSSENTNKIIVNTSGWENGNYNIVFADYLGAIIATSEIRIR